jgi:hypothetical protein
MQNTYRILAEILTGRNHSVYMNIDGKVLSKCILKQTECDSVNWILLVQDKNQWWGLVNKVMNL